MPNQNFTTSLHGLEPLHDCTTHVSKRIERICIVCLIRIRSRSIKKERSQSIPLRLSLGQPPGHVSVFTSLQIFGTIFPELSLDGECGRTKGCFLYPDWCSGNDCRYAVSFKPDQSGSTVAFEVTAITPGYVSFGISKDKQMVGYHTFVKSL